MLMQELGCSAVFSAFYLLFSLSTMLINAKVALVYGSGLVSLFYAIGLVTMAVGFIAFGLTFRFTKIRRVKLLLAGILYAVSLLCLLFLDSLSLVTVSFLICPFAYGFIGGSVHLHTAERLCESTNKGKVVGGGYCLTVFVQFFIQHVSPNPVVLAALLLAVLVLVLWQNLRDADLCSSLNKTDLPEKSHDGKLWTSVAIVAAVALIAGIYDGMSARLYAENAIDLVGWTRLMVGVGAVISGFLFDRKRHMQINIIILCAALANTVAILLLSTAQSYLAAQLLFTSGMGFYIVYVLVSFIDSAPQNKNPALWAGAGRIAHSLALSVTTALAGIFGSMQPVVLDIIGIVMFLITLLLFVFSGRLSLPAESPHQTDADVLTDDKLICLFSAQYHLTQRETEVFEKLITTEDVVQEIADSLYISRRVLQRYITAIYEKTGTKTRIGLFQSFMDFKKKK